MAAVIWADKIFNVGQYVFEWKTLIIEAAKAALNSPTLICKGESFLNDITEPEQTGADAELELDIDEN